MDEKLLKRKKYCLEPDSCSNAAEEYIDTKLSEMIQRLLTHLNLVYSLDECEDNLESLLTKQNTFHS